MYNYVNDNIKGYIINYEYYLESGDVTSSENITIPVLTNQQYTYQLNNLNPFTNFPTAKTPPNLAFFEGPVL